MLNVSEYIKLAANVKVILYSY